MLHCIELQFISYHCKILQTLGRCGKYFPKLRHLWFHRRQIFLLTNFASNLGSFHNMYYQTWRRKNPAPEGLMISAPHWSGPFGPFGKQDLDHLGSGAEIWTIQTICAWTIPAQSVIGVWYSHSTPPCHVLYLVQYTHPTTPRLPWAMIEQQSSNTMVAFPPTALTPSLKRHKETRLGRKLTHNILISVLFWRINPMEKSQTNATNVI